MNMDKVIRYLIWIVLAVIAIGAVYTMLKNVGMI